VQDGNPCFFWIPVLGYSREYVTRALIRSEPIRGHPHSRHPRMPVLLRAACDGSDRPRPKPYAGYRSREWAASKWPRPPLAKQATPGI
jgi:hypothetical protein